MATSGHVTRPLSIEQSTNLDGPNSPLVLAIVLVAVAVVVVVVVVVLAERARLAVNYY